MPGARAAIGWAGLSAMAALLLGCHMSPAEAVEGVAGPAAGAPAADVLLAAAGLAAWLLLGWVALCLALATAAALPGLAGRCARALARAVVPATVRRLLTAALGISLVTVPAAGTAAGADPRGAARAGASAGLDLDWPGAVERPSPTPSQAPSPAARDVPTAYPPPAAAPPAQASPTPAQAPAARAVRGTVAPPVRGVPAARRAAFAADPDGLVVVHRGDTLWDIAARHLGPRATDAEVAAEWPRWWSANRGVIGAEPDLLLPGQRLTPPERSPR